MKNKVHVYLGELIPGKFVRRVNRFVAIAKIKGKMERVYLRDTGRLKDYFHPDNVIYTVEKNFGNPEIRYLLRAVDFRGKKVMADPFLDTLLIKKWLESKGLDVRTKHVKRKSVFDLSWKNCICEVKGANLHFGDYAVFPDVYSERAERHFMELSEMNGCRWLIFVSHFTAKGIGINPEFEMLERILKNGKNNGLTIKAVSTKIVGNYWLFDKEIPFIWFTSDASL